MDRSSRFRDQGLGVPLSKVGFPIRKSTDQSFFAAPRSLSQRSTSFIASQRQGIHQMPLSTLDRSSHQCPPHSAEGIGMVSHFFIPSLARTDMTERPALLLRIAPTTKAGKACRRLSRRSHRPSEEDQRTVAPGCRLLQAVAATHVHAAHDCSCSHAPGTIPSSRCQTTHTRSA